MNTGVVSQAGSHCCRYCHYDRASMGLLHAEMDAKNLVLRNPEHFVESLTEIQRLRKIVRGGQGAADELLQKHRIIKVKV